MPRKDRRSEVLHLQECTAVIRRNVERYSAKLKEVSAETKEMYDMYRSSDESLHNDLVVGLDLQSQMAELLRKNEAALGKPYFGRIDYEEDREYSLYIGKNGIRKNLSEVMIVDWRAPIATVYYDGDIGEGSYRSPTGEDVSIALHLKRTFEIAGGQLKEYYDTDVIANDDFLTKYLGQNKNVVLGEIIATIQKEQNQVIRDAPWHSVIVQGAAGSGKTTVAMHRISYLLYNYKERFKPQEFYVIGSNQMLLNYITGVLPSLDVHGVGQMTMEELLWESLEGDFTLKARARGKKASRAAKSIDGRNDGGNPEAGIKGRSEFALAFEEYYRRKEEEVLAFKPVMFQNREIYGMEDVRNFLHMFWDIPLDEKLKSLNERVINKIQLKMEQQDAEKSQIREEVKRYRTYFERRVNESPLFRGKGKNPNRVKTDLADVYEDFLRWYASQEQYEGGDAIWERFRERDVDLMDLAMLNLIKRRLRKSEGYERISHMVVDEAQDFGGVIFYVLKQLFKGCTYTIMGDVSQNIHYDTGMNDWRELRNVVFNPERDQFYVLAKSYRNTVEISHYATAVLTKCTFETYGTEPIIRHGKAVEEVSATSERDMLDATVQRVRDMVAEGHTTVAVICRDDGEATFVREELAKHMEVEGGDYEEMQFGEGVMALPIHLTKGLEFDAVVLYNPDKERYPRDDAHAKLLYVAITRALHELCVIYRGELSELLQGE